MREMLKERIRDSINVKRELLCNDKLLSMLEKLADEIVRTIRMGNKVILCGNGGSASDALHFAGEMVGRFQKERNAWSVIVLNSNITVMTAIANDYGYDNVFARQAQAHCNMGDVFIGISTSGNSENVLRAVNVAKVRGCKTAALLGKDGGKIIDEVTYPIVVPCDITPRVQESHILLIHIICEIVELKLCAN